MSTIILTCDTQTLTIQRFSSASYPRERINGPSFSQSAYGSSVRQGTWYEPFHSWSIDCRLTQTEKRVLNRIYGYWLFSKPSVAVFLDDWTIEFSEPAPRTRAIASGATETITGNMVDYFARFQVEFSAEPKFSQDGIYVATSLQFIESAKVPA